MKIITKLFTTLSAVAMLCVATGSIANENLETQAALNQFKASAQTQPFFLSSYGYAVFPSVGKGGFWVGGAYGSGTVYKDHDITGTAKLYQLSFGLQFGGQSYSEIIFFQDKRAYERFTSGSFELDAQASAVALTEGAQAKAGTAGFSASASDNYVDTNYTNGISVFTFAKGGMMVEASLAGQKFSFKPLHNASADTLSQDIAQDITQPVQLPEPAPTAMIVETVERPE
ncbi:YSC84-related protein [Photobacterium minamisatsumaniensis]|uniref:lipid-binding SYLF domain-containing protein n=1 Tax=Photobacterium minamisatsumaniensis TaxID=2910233 RepID=UPI003D102B7B